jgi:hypothetical protein|tara:strand:- start:1 stop:276 length:276 start_codon:yes stop_codon:yes gene_type:complete
MSNRLNSEIIPSEEMNKKCIHIKATVKGFFIEEYILNPFKEPFSKNHKRVIQTAFMSSNEAMEYLYYIEKNYKEFKDYIFIYPKTEWGSLG